MNTSVRFNQGVTTWLVRTSRADARARVASFEPICLLSLLFWLWWLSPSIPSYSPLHLSTNCANLMLWSTPPPRILVVSFLGQTILRRGKCLLGQPLRSTRFLGHISLHSTSTQLLLGGKLAIFKHVANGRQGSPRVAKGLQGSPRFNGDPGLAEIS